MVRQEEHGVTATRHFARFGGGSSEARNVYFWNGQRVAYDAQLSNHPEVGPGETMVER